VKITITPAGGTAFVLGDDSAQANVRDGFRPKQTRIAAGAALFRAAYGASLPRYNLENRLAFTVERTFATVEAALSFMAGHADQVPAQGTVALYNMSATGQITRSLANAVVAEVECVEHTGVSCKFQYTIAGQGAWQ
jgi:hypothetical protein